MINELFDAEISAKIANLEQRMQDEFRRYQSGRDASSILPEKDLDMLILEAMEMSQAHA